MIAIPTSSARRHLKGRGATHRGDCKAVAINLRQRDIESGGDGGALLEFVHHHLFAELECVATAYRLIIGQDGADAGRE